MTTSLSEQAWEDLFAEIDLTAQVDPLDPLDLTWHYPKPIGQGYRRWIELRDGMELEIADMQLADRLVIQKSEFPEDYLQYHFHLWGKHADKQTTVGDREFCIKGSGLSPQEMNDGPEQQALEITLSMRQDVLQSFVADQSGQLPPALQAWVRPVEQERYARVAKVTLAMERVLWEILRCPFSGISKRLFLEGKGLELVSLVIEQELEIQGQAKPAKPLKPGTRDRLHYARDLLLQNLHQPPTLVELAEQAQLNEYTLKKGFKQVFGTTVFDYLLAYRLDQARQMLEQGQMRVSEVMAAVGMRDRHHFATVFRKKFGITPRELLRSDGLRPADVLRTASNAHRSSVPPIAGQMPDAPVNSNPSDPF
ncbi:MAG: AraC family transcriptional regulator [Aphanocapsa sp. GSE-SYN-MK-11-07L]|jgi:AraC-like DNA-binding protein|nr:AraC family transcriptional regulator [Aphanocapsa sp. GSE-SYN-MK-11-07L]